MIKFTYFDVGGVMIQDFSNGNRSEEIRQFLHIDNLWKRMIILCLNIFPKKYDRFINNQIKEFKRNESIWLVVNEINKNSKIGLLTNMYPNMLNEIKNAALLPKIDWDVIVDSSIVHNEKPNKEIFRIAEEMSGFKGDEILFIDNGKKNVESAKEFGWNTFLYNPNDCDKSNKDLLKFFEMTKIN